MKQATLCLLLKEDTDGRKLLLAMKKRGFGEGKWNGVGGKIAPEKGDKSIIDAVLRETEEEIGVQVKDLEKVALLRFEFAHRPDKDWDQDVHVFVARDWTSEPVESEEMAPQWFGEAEIPFDEMWPGDRFWLPHVLEGRKLKAKFIFGEGEIIIDQDVKVVPKLA